MWILHAVACVSVSSRVDTAELSLVPNAFPQEHAQGARGSFWQLTSSRLSRTCPQWMFGLHVILAHGMLRVLSCKHPV